MGREVHIEAALNAWDSSPLSNLVNEMDEGQARVFRGAFYTFNRRVLSVVGPFAVDRLTDVLGRQSYCWSGGFKGRLWVWELHEKRIRIFASRRVLSFEVRADLTLAEKLAEFWWLVEKLGDMKYAEHRLEAAIWYLIEQSPAEVQLYHEGRLGIAWFLGHVYRMMECPHDSAAIEAAIKKALADLSKSAPSPSGASSPRASGQT